MTSPSGRYELALTREDEERGGRGGEYRRLRLSDRDGRTGEESPERFGARVPLEAAWGEQERAWVASADTGTVVFARGPDGWERAVWDPDSPAPTMWDAGANAEVPVITDAPPAELAR